MRYLAITCLFLFTMSSLHAYNQAFDPTAPGVIEIKTLPQGRLLESKGGGDYFNQSNSLFRPLFKYISQNDIAMTTPVEARIDPGTMYFWVSQDQVDKANEDTAQVRVIDVKERLVAAIGEQGGYSQKNFETARDKLLEWVGQQKDLVIIGEPFAVYWNSPFTPWFLKKFEVLVPVRNSRSE